MLCCSVPCSWLEGVREGILAPRAPSSLLQQLKSLSQSACRDGCWLGLRSICWSRWTWGKLQPIATSSAQWFRHCWILQRQPEPWHAWECHLWHSGECENWGLVPGEADQRHKTTAAKEACRARSGEAVLREISLLQLFFKDARSFSLSLQLMYKVATSQQKSAWGQLIVRTCCQM